MHLRLTYRCKLHYWVVVVVAAGGGLMYTIWISCSCNAMYMYLHTILWWYVMRFATLVNLGRTLVAHQYFPHVGPESTCCSMHRNFDLWNSRQNKLKSQVYRLKIFGLSLGFQKLQYSKNALIKIPEIILGMGTANDRQWLCSSLAVTIPRIISEWIIVFSYAWDPTTCCRYPDTMPFSFQSSGSAFTRKCMALCICSMYISQTWRPTCSATICQQCDWFTQYHISVQYILLL